MNLRRAPEHRDPIPNPGGPLVSPRWGRAMLCGWRPLVAVLGVACLVRVVYCLQYHASPLNGYYVLDHQYYLEWARRIAAGDLLGDAVFEQTPLYPYLLAATFRAWGERMPLVLALQLAAGLGMTWLAYLSARRLFVPAASLGGGLLVALYGPLVFYECLAMKSFLSPVLTVVVLYAGLRWADGGRLAWLAVQGGAIGLACLERENHVLLWIPAALWVWGQCAAQGRSWGWRWGQLGVLTAAMVACLIPSTLRNYLVAGEFVVVTAGGGEVFYMAHGPHANGYYRAPDFVKPNPFVEHEDFRREAERRAGRPLTRGQSSRFWFREALRYAASHPVRTVALTAKKAVILLNDFEVNDSENFRVAKRVVGILKWLPSFGWISGLGLVGVVACWRQGRQGQLLVGLVAAHVASVLLTYNFGRFRLGLMPLWCLLAAYGAAWLVDAWRSGNQVARRRAAGYALIAVLATVLAFLPPPGAAEMTYAVDDELLLGRLACRAGDFDLAEMEYQYALWLMRQHEEQFPDPRGNQEALLAVRVGDELLRYGQSQRAIPYYRHALQLPNRDPEREVLLRRWVSVLRTFWRHGVQFEELPDPLGELQTVVAELQQLNPQEPAYWAIGAQWTRDESEVRRVRRGLAEACGEEASATPEKAAWCWMGQAFLARAQQEPEEMRRCAEQALKAWPEHPWRAEIQELLSP